MLTLLPILLNKRPASASTGGPPIHRIHFIRSYQINFNAS